MLALPRKNVSTCIFEEIAYLQMPPDKEKKNLYRKLAKQSSWSKYFQAYPPFS
jgi:hypothetical protein